MKFWIAGLVFILLAGGALFMQDQGASALDPFRVISVPPPPETEIPADFVPSSAEVAENAPQGSESAGAISDSICTGGDSSDFDCYEQHYVKLVKEQGIGAAFVDLKARYAKNNYVVAQCHPLTHVIGREAAYKFSTPGEAYTQGDGFCWSGYYHGILETFLEEIGRHNLPQEINTICDGVKGADRYSFDYYNCVHGLGHGVMAITQTELFESLDYCDLLEGSWEQKSCASGVFMENVIVDNLNHFTKYLKPEQPLYPCTDVTEKYKETCYLMQTSYILKINGGDFSDTFAWCRKAEESYKATCLQSLGRDVSGRTSSNAAESKRLCLLGRDSFERENCVIGAVKDFISYFHSDKEAKMFCDSLEDQKLISVCHSTAEDYYTLF